MTLTVADRCDAFAAAFPNPAAHLHVVQEQRREVMYGTWLLGNDYRNKTRYYGAYPPGYVDRVLALFPDLHHVARPGLASMSLRSRVLHLFSGSLPPGPYVRVDLAGERCDYRVSAQDLWAEFGGNRFALTLADPPYSREDAEQYGTPMIDRRTVLASVARVTEAGGFLCWLDCVWPMFSKRDWRTVGRVTIIRSTNHRVRMLSIFERAV